MSWLWHVEGLSLPPAWRLRVRMEIQPSLACICNFGSFGVDSLQKQGHPGSSMEGGYLSSLHPLDRWLWADQKLLAFLGRPIR